MPYAISNSRNLQIANRITNAANKDDKGPAINALTELLKIDTTQSNADFITRFRELKNIHPFVNDLCQRRGFLGSIGYAFRGDNYRAERYKAIIDQLNQGSYNNQDNNKTSYFDAASNLKQSVCEKVEDIKNGYLAKTYTSAEDKIYKDDKIVFEELKRFNENLGFKPSKATPIDTQTKDDNDMVIWEGFVKANPKYLSLNLDNQDNVEFNINGTSVQNLKQEVLKRLSLPKDTKLFTEDNKLNSSVGNAIKHPQHQAARKIQDAFRGFRDKLANKSESEFGFKHLKHTSKEGVCRKYIISKNLHSFRVPNINIKNGPRGTFKRVIGKNNGSVLFYDQCKGSNTQHPWNSHEIEKVLDDLKIGTFKVTHKVAPEYSMARNAGNYDLVQAKNMPWNFNVSSFNEILLDLKTLHSNGYFHLDIKPDNIQVKIRDNGHNPILSVVDLDSFSSLQKRSSLSGTPLYTTDALLFTCFPEWCKKYGNEYEYEYNKKPPSLPLQNGHLQTLDEFAAALTIMDATRVNIRGAKPGVIARRGGLKLKSDVVGFIENNISLEHQDQFKELITNPEGYADKYLNTTTQRIYLSDMLGGPFSN